MEKISQNMALQIRHEYSDAKVRNNPLFFWAPRTVFNSTGYYDNLRALHSVPLNPLPPHPPDIYIYRKPGMVVVWLQKPIVISQPMHGLFTVTEEAAFICYESALHRCRYHSM